MDAIVEPRNAAQILVEVLVKNGVDHVFCVPGESYLAVLDALYDSPIQVTTCRQEGGAAMMAEAYGKATGRPGICFVTRGPGATNASPGIHIAQQDSTPMILFVGQIERGFREREAFQEMDYRAVFGSMTKWTTEIDQADRTAELVSRAFYMALSGRPGPVVVSLPEDMLTESAGRAHIVPCQTVETSPGEREMAALETLLKDAQRPLVVIGGTRWSPASCARLTRFAEKFELPVMTSYRRLPLFDALHPNYAGDFGLAPNPKVIARIKNADLLIVIGGRLGEIPTQSYQVIDIPVPQMKLVHVLASDDELGRVYNPHLAIHASPDRFTAALEALTPPSSRPWAGETAVAHADYLAWSDKPGDVPGDVNLGEVMVWLRDHLPTDAIICNGAGNYAAWIHRYYRFRSFATHIAPTSASMGYGVPAAAAMKRLYPNRIVISLNGDGDFLMNGQEFATAVQYELPIITIIADNGIYGTIRMHQEREYPGRTIATQLRNPDFAAYADAFGGRGYTVERTADFADAFTAAKASGLPSIIHLTIDPDAITPATTLSAIRTKALAGA